MTNDDDSDVTVADLAVRPDESDEYELVAVATARVDGPDGQATVRRRYEALPRHNDVVDRTAVDVNDELVDRPDVVHVHAKWYAGDRRSSEGGDDGEDGSTYLRDAHETWRPDDPTILADAAAFRDAVREHLLATVEECYGATSEALSGA